MGIWPRLSSSLAPYELSTRVLHDESEIRLLEDGDRIHLEHSQEELVTW